MRFRATWPIILNLLLCSTAAWADTLIARAGGAYQPRLATAWKAIGDTCIFTLNPSADGIKIAQLIAEKLGVRANFADGKVTVVGLSEASLLAQLATLQLSGPDDPLADLGGLGGSAVAANLPEPGGSIRAARPVDMLVPVESETRGAVPSVDPNGHCHGQVIEVQRGPFPNVTLKIRVQQPPGGALQKELRRGRVIAVTMLFIGTPVDLQNSANQANLAAFYLKAGDKVSFHPVPQAQAVSPLQYDKMNTDWLERR